jgi:hypothetical protein
MVTGIRALTARETATSASTTPVTQIFASIFTCTTCCLIANNKLSIGVKRRGKMEENLPVVVSPDGHGPHDLDQELGEAHMQA